MDTYQRLVNQKYEKNSKDNLDMRVMQYKREEAQDNTYSAEEKQRVYDSLDRHREEEKHNYTGIPDDLKAQVEEKSGLSLDDVKVMYNSAVPASFQALAVAQGTNVYLGAGQEKHLAHELGHVVQQKQGRVKPTTNVNGVPVNDDASLEHEADTMQMKKEIYQRKETNNQEVAQLMRVNISRNPKKTNYIQIDRVDDITTNLGKNIMDYFNVDVLSGMFHRIVTEEMLVQAINQVLTKNYKLLVNGQAEMVGLLVAKVPEEIRGIPSPPQEDEQELHLVGRLEQGLEAELQSKYPMYLEKNTTTIKYTR